MIYNVSEAANLLDIDREIIKKWAFIFIDYLSSSANPGKGKMRKFLIDDMRIFYYILMFWEESPDIENIKYGLDSNDQFKHEPIDKFIISIKPLFRNMPEDIDETWRGVVFGGEFELGNLFITAESFKLAGDKLVEIAHDGYENRDLFQPAIYNYRHATELYIKSIIGSENHHDLSDLMSKLKLVFKNEFNTVPPTWFENLVEAFNYCDPKGTAFRYGITVPSEELYADMRHISTLMTWFAQVFKRIQNLRRDTR